QPPVVCGKGGDGPLEVLRDDPVELLDLRPARVGEPPSLIELLPAELHQVLVDDVADVLEVADEGNQRDLLAREVRAHRLAPGPAARAPARRDSGCGPGCRPAGCPARAIRSPAPPTA